MAEQRALVLVSFCLPGVLLSEAAKILTVSTLGGSHHRLMDRVSQILQGHGHQVTNLLRENSFISDLKKEEKSYQVISWLPPEDQLNEMQNVSHFFANECVHGRYKFHVLVKVAKHFGTLCSHLLSRRDIMDSLRNENFDLVFLEAFDFCSFLMAEKLGKPFVSFLPMTFTSVDFGLPSPLSYVPVYGSGLTDQMDFWGRVRNFLMYFDFSRKQRKIQSMFDDAIREHFEEGSWPDLSHLLQKAELWFVNSDFAFDFARPLLPNTVYVGGLLDKPTKPVPQDLENFITRFGDSGFVLVALGSLVSMYQTQELLKEMNGAFAHLPQGVIWNCKRSLWPKDVKLAANVKIMDWLPQNDLLAHPGIRLFVTHGGMNSIMEAIQHGVPIVGIPFCGDQPENMVRVEAKKFGVTIPLQKLKAETLALAVKEVIEDKRYAVVLGCGHLGRCRPDTEGSRYKSAAVAASIIRRSHPLTPAQRLVGWIDHVLQTGGAAHLKPYAFQQPWHEQYLLDVILFLLALTLGTMWLCFKLLGMVIGWLRGTGKLKVT